DGTNSGGCAAVYLGVIIENPKGSKVISDVVLAISFLVTLLCAGYVYWQMRKVRPLILAEERKRWEDAGNASDYQNYPQDEETSSPLLTQDQVRQTGPGINQERKEQRYEEYASSPYPPTYSEEGYGSGK